MTPQERVFAYDTGHWNGGHCLDALEDLAPDTIVHLMVISHSDGDHVGDADRILEDFRVERIIHTGHPGTSGSWEETMEAMGEEVDSSTASVRLLATWPLSPPERIQIDDLEVTLLGGWYEWTGSGATSSERRNAISIVARLDFAGRSILYTGDTIGRRLNDPDDACKDAEAWMVDRHRSGDYSLAADVLLAPHHGGNNGSSSCFLDAVDPRWVIFSAGHDHNHPSEGAAGRVLAEGVPLSRILRTDRGDDEGGFEWDEGSEPGCTDSTVDDEIEILISSDASAASQRAACRTRLGRTLCS